jgi:soluble lytic murein transglycosylase-like protein
MTRKHPPRRTSLFFCAAVFLCASCVTVSAQEARTLSPARSSASHARKGPTAKRSGARRLVKIRARQGDTLSLLGDRFGVSAEEIADLNGIGASAPVAPGSELLIPLPTIESLAKKSAESSTKQNESAPEAVDAWENVQGVLFRKGTAARLTAREISEAVSTSSERVSEMKEANDKQLARVVEAREAERSTVAQPVWIYLVGGARIEADSVNETEAGLWYKRGNLSIFIERSRIERVERERAANVAPDDSPSWTERGWTTGNPKFDALIRENGARYGVDPYLIFCVMEQESQFKPWVVSPKGARGLMQLMPGTAAHFGVRRPFDPAENIMGGTKYLKQLLENFNGRVDLVLAGYNAGEGAVAKYGGRVPPYRETRNYVQRISKRYGQTRSFVPSDAVENAPAPSGLR